MVKRYRGGLITANLALTVVGNYTNARAYSFTEYSKAKATGLTFTLPSPMPMQFLLVAGGGAGGNDPVNADGGGGGAGGFLEYANVFFSAGTTYTITVGAGATAPGVLGDGADGSNTLVFANNTPSFSYIAYGGGGGGTVTPDTSKGAGRSGGSGGGSGAYNQGKISTGSGVPGQGYPGGLGTEQPGIDFRCAGGGGAGQAGQSGPTNGAGYRGGWGGDGKFSTITGSNVAYAGGGGGYAYTPSGPISGLGRGGNGGGGGRPATNPLGSPDGNGSNNQGGGGGTNGSGGSGIVVLRYPTAASVSTVVTTGNPNVIYAESNVIYRFWQSGTFAWY